jgi:glycosyltransferase involved in cell wall biosynthesis
VGYFYFRSAQKKLDELISKHKPDHIYCQLIRTTEYVKNYSNVPKTLDYMDVFSKGMERRKNTAPIYLKPFFSLEHKRLLKYENSIFDYFDLKTIISEQDKNYIPHPKRNNIAVIPNGVDTSYFQPLQQKKEFDLLFNGNMNYPPNIESVSYLVKKIMPQIWKELPKTKLLISGAHPNAAVLSLASEHVIVSGWVDDIRVNFAKSRILVAPMQISIGLQNKLLEAMAMQLPCITSSLANNALQAKAGEQIIVANTPEEYAMEIKRLLQDETLMKQIALKGYEFATSKFKWEATTAKLSDLMMENSVK